MKKKTTHKKTIQSEEIIPDISGFGLEAPICFDDLEIGTLKINFDMKRDKTNTKHISKNILQVIHLADVLRNYIPFFKKKIEHELKIRFKYSDQIDQVVSRIGHDIFTLLMLSPLYYTGKRTMSQLGLFLYERENEIFELIKSEGPIILCHPIVQEKISKWISDKDIASEKMNKLSDSLLEYASEISMKGKHPKKVGRPKKDSVEKIGKPRIRLFYHLLLFLFKKIKKNKEHYKNEKTKEIIEHEGKDIFISLSKIQNDSEVIEVLKKLDKFVSKYEEKFYPITYYIENDEDLKSEFIRFRWEPNKLAKKIIAKLLNVSVYKIEDILYR